MIASQQSAGPRAISRWAIAENHYTHLVDLLRVTHVLAQLDDIRAILRLLNQTIVETLCCDRRATFLTEDDHAALMESFGASDTDLNIYRSGAYQGVAGHIRAWLAATRQPLVVNGPPFPDALTPGSPPGWESARSSWCPCSRMIGWSAR